MAKESADIVVLDDNFATIVQVAKWGRSVYNNIQKFVQFQLTVNIVALVINFVSACITGMKWKISCLFKFSMKTTGSKQSLYFSGTAPLTAVQLLWVNLIMDTLGALALATEAPDDSLMAHPPVGRGGRFITNIMWRNIAGQATYQLLVLGLLQYKGIEWLGLDSTETLNTLIFNSFVFCQVVFQPLNTLEHSRFPIP